MCETLFTIYSARAGAAAPGRGHRDVKDFALTRELYVRNCDARVAGNLSSIYQTLLALVNLSRDSFLRERIASDPGGWVPLSLLLTFNRMQRTGLSAAEVAAILQTSAELEVSEGRDLVRKRPKRLAA